MWYNIIVPKRGTEREIKQMNIVKKEILEFSEKESSALDLVLDMCLGIEREATDPELQKLVKELSYKLSILWGYRNNEMC